MAQLFYTHYFTPAVLQNVVACDFLQKPIKHEEINKKFDPIILLTQDGQLNQPNAILRYLTADSILNGSDSIDRIQLQQWFQYFNLDVHPVLRELESQVFGHKEPSVDKFSYCLKELGLILQIFNNYLKLRTFFVGNTISSFDICLACHLDSLFRVLIDQEMRKKIPHLVRWFTFVRSTAPFLNRYGKLFLCGKKSLAINKELVLEKPKTKQQVKQQAKQESKKEARKQETEEIERIESHEGNGFKLDDFKRQFQNSGDRVSVIQKLLDNFNEHQEKWSIWKIHYQKDVTQGKIDYLTMNLASGSLQRLEALRKNGFGSWGVYGSEGDYEVRGVMLWKGTEIAHQWKDHPSYAYHQFFKLDHHSQTDQQLIIDYWNSNTQAEGLPLYDSKKLI